jgi:hypothetical protein
LRQRRQNKVRFLSAPILGFEYWNNDNKPVRARELWESIPADARLDDGAFKPKHFWALVVYNYASKAVEILQITQTSIQTQITDLICNEDWGDPREYDLTINRKGQKLDTEYTVQPSPARSLAADVKAAFEAKPINLEALFDGANPFEPVDGAVAETVRTPAEEEDGSRAGF